MPVTRVRSMPTVQREISPFLCVQTQMSKDFSQRQAPSSQLGWDTIAEQDALHHQRVAIAGMPSAGVIHLLTIERPGIGKPKADVLATIAKKNKPEVDTKVFPKAVGRSYRSDLLDGADAPLKSDLCRGSREGGTGDRPKPGRKGTKR